MTHKHCDLFRIKRFDTEDWMSYRRQDGIEDTPKPCVRHDNLAYTLSAPRPMSKQATAGQPDGTVNYVMVSDVRVLTLKVSNIFRQLMTQASTSRDGDRHTDECCGLAKYVCRRKVVKKPL